MSIPPRSQQWQRSIPAFSAIRHASTAPAQSTQPTAASTTPPPETSTTLPDIDTITLDDIDFSTAPTDISLIPEKLGYLKEIGLDYGWGPTSILEWTMEHIHIGFGLPWWGSIAATAVLLRVCMIPLYLRSSDIMARQSAMMSVTKPITDRMTEARKVKDNTALAEAYQQLLAVRKRAGISMTKQFTPMIVQGVFGYCGFKLLRAMSNLPVPGLQTGGFLWMPDLTLQDPYLILPVIMAGSIHILIRMGGESGAAQTEQMNPGMMNFMKWGMPGIILIATGYQAGAVAVWFAAGGALGIAQSLLLQRPAVRKLAGIAPLYVPGKGDAVNKQSFAQWYEDFNPMKKKQSKTIDVTATNKNANYMSPTYQSPNIRSTSSSSTSPKRFQSPADIAFANAAKSSNQFVPHGGSDMISPATAPASNDSVFKRASDSWKHHKANMRDMVANARKGREPTEEELKEARRKDAQAYERRVQEKRRAGKGKGGR